MNQIGDDKNIIPDNYIAALDIGSNSFHFVYGRVIDQHLQILHSEKYRVKLATGLDNDNNLSQSAIIRGIATLENLATTVQNLSPKNFRVVATFTLRQAKNYQVFLDAAQKVFPFPIEIISGHEEARLIYQGVVRNTPPSKQCLVLDIGGGSTECVIGKNYQTLVLDSLTMGCVNYTQTFFADGSITKKQFDKAIKSAKHQINSIAKRFKKTGWQTATGTSGTIKAIFHLVNFSQQNKNSDDINHPITLKKLYQLQQQLIDFKHIDNITIRGLKENRRDVICAGLAILIALMESLTIAELHYCSYALREGVLYEQLESIPQLTLGEPSLLVSKHQDVQKNTIHSLSERFSIDNEQAINVEQVALLLYEHCAKAWNITKSNYKELLSWACFLHEIGMNINASSYHKHGQYIIEQSDLAGFNQEQQKALAWLVFSHRKSISPYNALNNYQIKAKALTKIGVLLRISVLLNQQRQLSDPPTPIITAKANFLQLSFNKKWLLARPIVDSDLFFEQQTLDAIGINLSIKST
ncbi:MAG: Ppx/GppA family phosphatase [Colwellia sp.]